MQLNIGIIFGMRKINQGWLCVYLQIICVKRGGRGKVLEDAVNKNRKEKWRQDATLRNTGLERRTRFGKIWTTRLKQLVIVYNDCKMQYLPTLSAGKFYYFYPLKTHLKLSQPNKQENNTSCKHALILDNFKPFAKSFTSFSLRKNPLRKGNRL